MGDRRQRVHELLMALLAQQKDLDLLDGDSTGSLAAAQANPAGWLERNRRILQRYQALNHRFHADLELSRRGSKQE